MMLKKSFIHQYNDCNSKIMCLAHGLCFHRLVIVCNAYQCFYFCVFNSKGSKEKRCLFETKNSKGINDLNKIEISSVHSSNWNDQPNDQKCKNLLFFSKHTRLYRLQYIFLTLTGIEEFFKKKKKTLNSKLFFFFGFVLWTFCRTWFIAFKNVQLLLV